MINKTLLPLTLLLVLYLSPVSAQKNCNPRGCRNPATFCCDKDKQNECATDEGQCSPVPTLSVCSNDCRTGCCIDNDRCGTVSECKSFPIYSLIVGFGVLILFIVSVSIYRIRRTRQLARLRIVALNGGQVSGHAGELSIASLIPTGVVVNNNPQRRARGPPIKEVAVQPYQQQDIVTENRVMAQPYNAQRQPQQFNFDQIEYALPPGTTHTQQPMNVTSQQNTVRL